jgi:carboxyl-terminal processing protease
LIGVGLVLGCIACSGSGGAVTGSGTTAQQASATSAATTVAATAPALAGTTSLTDPATTTATTIAPPVTAPLPKGLRWCPYIPGSPTAPEHADMIGPTAAAVVPPANSPVDAATTARQLELLDEFAQAVVDNYVDPMLNGTDWPVVVEHYRELVSGGLSDDNFYSAMKGLISELGDNHSRFESPANVAAADAALAGQIDYVGIGTYFQPIPEAGGVSVITVFPGSPAERVGLRAHDTVTAVDGASPLRVAGEVWHNPFLGPEGSTVAITVSRPGQTPETFSLVRARVKGAKLIDVCLVPGTRVAYVLLPGLLDTTVPDQLRAALTTLADGGPLDGVVIDNRMNGGGRGKVLESILSMFTAGEVGEFSSPDGTRPLVIEPTDVNGSQTVPLVVLVGTGTVSYGEVMSGVLQAVGRATLIGQTTNGNVETLHSFSFEDGSRLWLANETFLATAASYGPWEDTGIVPDVDLPTRWDLFDEATDPALAAAVNLLSAP